ncbi:MAG: type II toxin-antitoxin system RelE/ParE family toxin [Bacteroidetes bacterium]|nr:type II toxin-antitoxin system RelE/ParE family toxin [Bacteroidota bacterium]MBU2586242.1 type II toxin-antitoxin system RelE/ParE family toxin [Bacteroidota bacterium]
MIKSFADKTTQELFERQKVKKISSQILKTAYRKLLIIDAAENIEDLRIPSGNRLEKLTGDLSGKYSIRINDQWRIVFSWSENNAFEVKIKDYHKG